MGVPFYKDSTGKRITKLPRKPTYKESLFFKKLPENNFNLTKTANQVYDTNNYKSGTVIGVENIAKLSNNTISIDLLKIDFPDCIEQLTKSPEIIVSDILKIAKGKSNNKNIPKASDQLKALELLGSLAKLQLFKTQQDINIIPSVKNITELDKEYENLLSLNTHKDSEESTENKEITDSTLLYNNIEHTESNKDSLNKNILSNNVSEDKVILSNSVEIESNPEGVVVQHSSTQVGEGTK